ncbi:MAG: response regulator [Synergistaceae bacterium]|nr:response regulator [Synergistaceae bacterium]
MYKVFFVDDEAAMRAGLRDSLNRDGSSFSLVGEASDGELALSLISEFLPDILITDIKMPFMDGIELSRRVAHMMPWVKIIILSGHDEFEYARQAIRIGVSEYLLKPVTSAILFQALRTAAAQIEEERERRRTIEALEKVATDARRLKAEKALSKLIHGRNGAELKGAIEEELPEAFVGAGCCLAALVEIVPGDPLSHESDDGRLLARTSSLILSILAANENIVAFPEGAERIVFICAASDEKTLENEAYSAAQAVRHEGERNGSCRVSVALGSPVGHISELQKSMSGAKKAMRYLEKTGNSLILEYRDIDPGESRNGPKNGSFIDLKACKHCDIIEKSMACIAAHYADRSISLDTVAEHVGLSPNHFSTVFSQETGSTFIERLTRTRLDRARELLKSTSIRTSEIAYMVGYNDPHYFSYVFRKNVGMTPSEFRRGDGGPEKN